MAELAMAALLLDLDGTLWDSAAWYPEVIAKACGRPGSEIEEALRHGSVTRVLADFGITRIRFVRLCRDLGTTLVVFDRVPDTLASVAARDIAIGAVTNLPGWVARPMLQAAGLAPFLNIVIPYRRGIRPKPSPDTLLDALGRLRVPPRWLHGTWATQPMTRKRRKRPGSPSHGWVMGCRIKSRRMPAVCCRHFPKSRIYFREP